MCHIGGECFFFYHPQNILLGTSTKEMQNLYDYLVMYAKTYFYFSKLLWL